LIIEKGNAPLISFSFKQRSGAVVTLPTDTSKYKVWIRDSANVRQGTGTIQSINSSAGTCQYQSSTLDTANACIATWWASVDIGEPAPRDFEPQHIQIQDPTQV
jgi:hypothetical protein